MKLVVCTHYFREWFSKYPVKEFGDSVMRQRMDSVIRQRVKCDFRRELWDCNVTEMSLKRLWSRAREKIWQREVEKVVVKFSIL